jgi:iron-sulfur cluster assembly protein
MDICTLTEAAQSQINKLCSDNNCYGISLNVKGGGCAGFEYDWGIINSPEDVENNDTVIDAGSGKFIIGVHSQMFLIGTEVDYVTSIVGSNFEIKNPNAQSACGCGVSVNFNMDTIPQFIE